MEIRIKLEPGDKYVVEDGSIIVKYFGRQFMSRRNYGARLSRPFVALEILAQDAKDHNWQVYRPNYVTPRPDSGESVA